MSYWPYRTSVGDVCRGFFILTSGVIVGYKCVTSYYEPLKEYNKQLTEGKSKLLEKYRRIHEERLKRLGYLKDSE